MSLEKCRECRGKVSSEAKTCPHCGIGEPYKPPPPPTKWEKRIGRVVQCAFLGFLVWVGWSVYNYEPPPKTPEEIAKEKAQAAKEQREKKKQDQERRWAMERNVDCASIIKRKYAHTGMEIETPWTRRSSQHYVASSLFHQKFTLQNAFGVKVKYSGVCVYDAKKRTVKLNVVKGWRY